LRPAKPNSQILEEASTWFAEFCGGEVASSDCEAFSAWLKASPEHVRAYLAASAIFDDLGALEKHRTADAQALIDRVLAEGNVVRLEDRRAIAPAGASSAVSSTVIVRRWRRAALVTAAAITSVALALGVWQVWFAGIYASGIGEQRVLNLADGSTIELNADTRVRVHWSNRERLVDLLGGQALFYVARDPRRPFVVRSDTTRVRAVGTRFDVNRQTHDTVVTVLEGRVAVAASEQEATPPLYVSAGEQVILTAQAASKRLHPDVAAATAWREKKLVFSSSPLTDVVGEYNRYHEKRLRVADPALSDFRISGVFSAEDATSLIAFLRDQPNIALEEAGGEILLRSK
jgi:transmembrane sensor